MSCNLLISLWLARTTCGHGIHPIPFGGSFTPTEGNRANCKQTRGFKDWSYDQSSHIEEIQNVSYRHTTVNDVGSTVDTERRDFHG